VSKYESSAFQEVPDACHYPSRSDDGPGARPLSMGEQNNNRLQPRARSVPAKRTGRLIERHPISRIPKSRRAPISSDKQTEPSAHTHIFIAGYIEI